MLVSLILAWLAVFFAVMTALKFAARISKSKGLNRFFRKIHIPFGEALIVAGLLHGLIAGNIDGTPIGDIWIGTVLFTVNAGTVCFVMAVLLAVSYLCRKTLKRKWLVIHRILTVLMIAALVWHIAVMGITLPSRIFTASQKETAADVTETTDSVSEDTTAETVVKVLFSGAVLKDGVYEGSADGYNGTIKLEVTVTNGQVSDIAVVSQNETPKFFQQAKQIINTILGSQSLEADAVSGATYSSAGILNAVRNALADAVISGELDITEIQLNGRKHH